MGSIPHATSETRPRSRDTGFPEPFCGSRNTTLPHPDADLSPNASISADDVSVNKALHRSRRSFLAKNRRTISYGKIKPGELEQQIVQDILESEEEDLVILSSNQEKHNILTEPMRDAGDSLDRTSGSSLDSDDYRHGAVDVSEGKRRRLFRKLRIHRHH